jgi:hypothetical protein
VTSATDAQEWPFLAVLMSTPREEVGEEEPEPPRVRGLGFVHRGAIVTLAHVAETTDIAALTGESTTRAVQPLTVDGDLALMRLSGPSTTPVTPELGQAKGPVAVAIVSDVSASVGALAGFVDEPDSAERFTVMLDSRLGEDSTVSGSPVVAGDTVVGIAGPTATSGSVDAFGHDAIRRLLDRVIAGPSPVVEQLSPATERALDEASEIAGAVGPAAAVLLSVLQSGARDTPKTVPAQLFLRVGTQRLVAAYERFTRRPIAEDPRSREE